MTEFPFIGPAYVSRSSTYSAQRCINFFLEPGKGDKPAAMIGAPGLTAPVVTLSGGGMRGMHKPSADIAVMVCGPNVYRVNSDFTTSVIGTVTDDGRPVIMAGNGIEVAIVSADTLYSVTTSGTTSTLVRTGTSSVDFLDGYFVITDADSGQFLVSGLYTTTIDELDFATAEGSPDNLVRLIVSHRQAFLGGEKTFEVWYNSGGTDFPLSRIDGAYVEMGLIAKDSLAKLDEAFWLGGDDNGAGSVWTFTGGAPKRISDHAVEYAISQWPDPTDAEAFCYTQEGHGWYVLSSQSGNQTWAYDVSTSLWFQRAYLKSDGTLSRIRPRCHLYFAGKNLVGDWENGNVYEYSLDAYSDNGSAMLSLRSCPTLRSGLKIQRTKNLRIDMDVGVGLTTGQGSDPQVMLRFSRDGGQTWSSALWRTAGAIGQYGTCVQWLGVGGGTREVYEVSITDPVKRHIVGAYIE